MRVMIKNEKAQPPRVMEIVGTSYDIQMNVLSLIGPKDTLQLSNVSTEVADAILQELFNNGKIDLTNNPIKK